MLPLISQDKVNSLSNNRLYVTTRANIGKPMNSTMKRLSQYVPNTVWNKTLTDTLKDYQDHNLRKQLNFKTGFNQKGFSFLGSDSYLTVSDYFKF